jgi:hypothetical protein
MMEWDEAEQKVERLQQGIKKVYSDILEVPIEVDAPLEEKVSNISEVFQGFHKDSRLRSLHYAKLST